MAEMDVLVDLAALGDGEPRVVVRPRGGSWRVDVVDRDRVGLFADTAGLLAAHGLVVRTAVLRTRHGVAVDRWHVESPGGDAPDGARIGRGLARLAAGDRTPLERLQRRRPPDGAAADSATAGVRTPLERLQRRRPPDGAAADSATAGDPGGTRALVVPHASADATVLEVRTQDRPGLLHELGAAFAAAGLSVRSAHIATYAGQTLDTFYLTGLDGGRLSPAEVAQTVARVIDTCDGPT